MRLAIRLRSLSSLEGVGRMELAVSRTTTSKININNILNVC
jgi:hypothetical protein